MEEKIDIKEKLQEGYVRAVLIIEILGRPPEHVSSALKTIFASMEKDKKLTVVNKKLYKPKKVKHAADFYTAFMEVDILANGLLKLFEVCFDYMPSSIEIIEPSFLKLNLPDANAVINDLATRLHKYDEVAKRLNIEKQLLQNKLNELTPNIQEGKTE